MVLVSNLGVNNLNLKLINFLFNKKGSRKCVKKPRLTPAHVRARLKFSNNWINKQNQMKRLVFVDEKTFTGTPVHSKYSLRRAGESFESKHIDFVANSGLSVNTFAHIGTSKYLI